MIKSEKWKIIGEAFLTPLSKRTKAQLELCPINGGLCLILYGIEGSIGLEEICLDLRAKYYPSFKKKWNGSWAPNTNKGDIWRGMFALFMSEAVKTEKGW